LPIVPDILLLLLLLLLYLHLQASDVLALMLDPSSKRGAALRAAMPGGVPPALPQLFSVGQFVRCVVAQLTTAAAAGGEQDEAAAAADAGAGEAHAMMFVTLHLMCLGIQG
jgi:hypothetical protein